MAIGEETEAVWVEEVLLLNFQMTATLVSRALEILIMMPSKDLRSSNAMTEVWKWTVETRYTSRIRDVPSIVSYYIRCCDAGTERGQKTVQTD